LDLTGPIAPSYRRVVDGYLRAADGIVLLYDITCNLSFASVIHESYLYAWTCRDNLLVGDNDADAIKKRFGCVLVGNKRDVLIGEDVAKRQVGEEMAEQWASSQGVRHFEITANKQEEVDQVVEMLVDSIIRARRMDERDKACGVRGDGRSVMRLLKRTT
jgi:GTPase SAR1 family protein